ncbi:hypothetical protein BK704_00935 [[Bacillus thuringiensis] serovar konkukian]|nr:hypothetical protein A9498_29170 [Bacillus thuringiensis serovar coreanensis]MED1303864.1 hypothetical protein [Bacillus pacificus]OUB19327.1 hypothetical protein BK704_00935 [[Bacillus thuringiensis] serovar konkukian]
MLQNIYGENVLKNGLANFRMYGSKLFVYVVNDDVIYRKVRLKDMKFGTSNDEDVKITGLK